MTTAKDMNSSRPSSIQRLSTGSMASSLPSHKSRIHSHSLSTGAINAHRVSRRKSMTLKPDPSSLSQRRSSKSTFVPRGPPSSTHPELADNVPNNDNAFAPSSYGGREASVLVDGPPLGNDKETVKARARRASEGSHLSKGQGKRKDNSDLRCDTCGKGYKHSSCLTKHLWEHTPEWSITSKFLISKHQQVQMLEAASVLVGLNNEAAEGATKGESDHSSASPAASGSSDLPDDDMSSTDTTPPPQTEEYSKRYSNASSLPHSYQSGSIFSDGPTQHWGHYRQWSQDRPDTSATSYAGSNYGDEDHVDMAAAMNLLSCSYGTPKSGPVSLPPDVPPVPPLPAKYLSMNKDALSGSANTPTAPLSRENHSRDVDMDDDDESYPGEDASEGFFGKMEE